MTEPTPNPDEAAKLAALQLSDDTKMDVDEKKSVKKDGKSTSFCERECDCLNFGRAQSAAASSCRGMTEQKRPCGPMDMSVDSSNRIYLIRTLT